jgi:hypothetical protein
MSGCRRKRRGCAQIDALFAKAEGAESTEDARFGVARAEQDLPAELERRESRLAKIKQAKRELEEEAIAARAAELRKNASAGCVREGSRRDQFATHS